MSDPLPGLGSLAQSARQKHFRRARTVLIVVGILMVLGHAAMCAIELPTVKDEIQNHLRKSNPGVVFDPAVLQEAEETARRLLLLIHGGGVALGIAFIVLGIFVERAPVPITAIALVLFIGREIVFALIDPVNLASGWLIKIIFLVALVKALQAAIASQSEARSADLATETGA